MSQTSVAAAAVNCARVPARSRNLRACGSGGTKPHASSLLTMMIGQGAALNADSCALQAFAMDPVEARASRERQRHRPVLRGCATRAVRHDVDARAPSFPNHSHQRDRSQRIRCRLPIARLARRHADSCRCARVL